MGPIPWREWEVQCIDPHPIDRRTVGHVIVQHTVTDKGGGKSVRDPTTTIEVKLGEDRCAVLTGRQALDLAALLICCAHGWNRAEVYPWLPAAKRIPQTDGSPVG